MSRDQKAMMLLSPIEKCPMDFYQGVLFYCPNLITVAPATRDKGDLTKSHDYEVMMSLPPDLEYPIEPFE